MNDFVLCGFCEKCGSVCEMWEGIWRHISFSKDCEEKWLSPDFIPGIIPVLSPKQMAMILESNQYDRWRWNNHYRDHKNINALIEFLEKDPFLVAKILSDAGKESV